MLINVAYGERNMMLTWAQHFGVDISGGWVGGRAGRQAGGGWVGFVDGTVSGGARRVFFFNPL